MKMTVTAGDGALQMDWEPPEDVPLSSFLLEYGIDEDKYTEKRLINPQLKNYILRDLMNGVLYYVKLTPISVDGSILEDIAATGSGTPDGEGFHPAPGCDPEDPTCVFDPGPLPPTPPNQPTTGLPPIVWWIAGGVTIALAYLHIRHRRQLQQTARFLQVMQQKYSVKS
jgi:hypothetical protein